ncbi:PROTEIN MODIFIER OF SNC1 11 [Salix purpurea]|uniref:PROTEIN MODIFIER OF SNC1 11 n=1 Tax=Salix purpurea TaxID=77065 RepID=A0A9Q0Q3H8_SALPP|nr:PROTEIN MODIFIER OF SNC1 11 [Salix purpurea]
MATQTENPSTDAATNITVEDNPSETLETAVPASTKPDRVEDSTTTASSIVESPTEGPKQGADNSKSASPATDSDKKFRRAERFGINVQLSEKEKRNSRAERFGTGSQGSEPESDSVKKSEELKRKARAERFGIPVPPTATDVEVKKKARVERFAVAPKIDALEENKRKARALRFSQSSSDSLSMNGKGDLEPKAAIAGKAGGGFSVLTLEILLVASILIFIFQKKNSQMQHSSFSDNSLQGIRQDFDNPHFRLPIDVIYLGA